jgi:hypothetical protein
MAPRIAAGQQSRRLVGRQRQDHRVDLGALDDPARLGPALEHLHGLPRDHVHTVEGAPERDDEGLHPLGRREEDRAGGGRAPALAEAEQEAPRALEPSGHLGGARRQAELAGVAGVDAADQRVDQPIQHLRAEPLLDERPEVVGGGMAAPHERFEHRPRLARPAQQVRAGQRAEAGGHPQHQSVRDGVQRAVPPDVGPAGRGRHKVVEAQLLGEVDGPGHPGEEGVGALVDRGQAGEGRGADLAAQPLVGLEHRHPRRRDLAVADPVAEVVRRAQARDAASDDGDVGHRPARCITSSATASSTTGSSFTHAVRAKARPWLSARRRAAR